MSLRVMLASSALATVLERNVDACLGSGSPYIATDPPHFSLILLVRRILAAEYCDYRFCWLDLHMERYPSRTTGTHITYVRFIIC